MTNTIRIKKLLGDAQPLPGASAAVPPIAGHSPFTSFSRKQLILVAAIGLAWLLVASQIGDRQMAYATFIVGVCITLWLSELVPPYVPTFLLWALTPLLLQTINDDFNLASVLGWSADPVIVLFLGGFTLSAAASHYQLDAFLAHWVVRVSAGRRIVLLALLAFTTTFLSMWMSNIAAAAMMIVALRPITAQLPKEDTFRRALLLAVALGANLGGMGTPISSGPNAIALAAISATEPITFLKWMSFALPLTAGLLLVGLLFVLGTFRVRGRIELPETAEHKLPPGARQVVVVFVLTILAWLTEPWHGIGAAQVALLAVAMLFGSGLLKRDDLALIDWSTLILIAGGLGIGRLLEASGLIYAFTGAIPWSHIPAVAQLGILSFTSATLSALMSNTATATMLIPLANTLHVVPSTAVLIALAASVGIPFIISTPPNAMVFGEGGLKSRDLLVVGMLIMLLGCLLITLTGPWVLNLLGI